MPKKSSKTGIIPAQQIEIADLGELVGANWANKYPQLVLLNYSSNDLIADSQQLKQALSSSKGHDRTKNLNTKALRVCNDKIDAECKKIRACIKLGTPDQNDYLLQLKIFGFDASRGYRSLPIDNGKRKEAIIDLIAALQSTANPYVLAGANVRDWQILQAEHSGHWDTSNQLRTSRKNLTTQADDLTQKVGDKLRSLYKLTEAQFSKADAAVAKRELGFLKESM